MGSVGFDVEDESQPSTSSGKKYKLPRTLLSGGGAVNHASVPRKLRSAVKKRGREAVTIPLPISRKKCRVPDGVERLRKYGARKSKLKTKQGHITKDEEEVAEALYALAGMFSDTNKSSPELDDDQPKAKSPAVLEAGSSMNSVQDNGTLKLQVDSMNSNSTTQVIKFQSSGDAEQAELPSTKQSASPIASGVQSDSTLLHRLSACDMTPSGQQAIELQQAVTSGTQYDKNYYPIHDKNYNGVFPSPSLSITAPESSTSQGFRKSLPAWFEKTNFASQRPATEKSITTEKYTRVEVESKKSWKRCSAHVYIGRLIKVLQVSERKEGLLPEKPTQVITCEGADLWTHHASIHNQMTGRDDRNDCVSFSHSEKNSSETQNDLMYLRAIQDQQLAPATPASSSKQGYDFLSLGSPVDTGVRSFSTRKGVNGAGESPEQFHASQNHSAMLFSLPQNGYSYSSTLAAQQVQIPQYIGSTFNGSVTHQLESQQQQKWAAQLQARYNTTGGGVPDWTKGARDPPSVLNYAHALFPQFHAAALQFSIPQQQLLAMNSSLPLPNMKKHHNNRNRLPLRLERNGAAIGPENIQQLQMPCNLRF